MKKNDKKKASFTFIDLFAGIGGIRIAFEKAGGECVFSSEWDVPSQNMYEANFGERPEGDIVQIKAKDIPNHDILTGGFPCQTFSIIGQKKGFGDTRGTMFFEIERILKEKRPKAFLLENVRNLKSHDGGRTLETIEKHLRDLGYFVHCKVLNGLDFGVPQKRERIMIVGFQKNYPFEFPTKGIMKPVTLEEVIDADEIVDPKHFISEDFKKKLEVLLKKQGKERSEGLTVWHQNKSGNISMRNFSCALRANASYNYLLVNGKRRLTPREMLRLQGFPEKFKIVVPDSQARKQAGNSVVIPKIHAVAVAMVEAMKKKPIKADK